MYTVWCEYGATGEGQTFKVLFTSGNNGSHEDRERNALEEFGRIFGGYYKHLANVETGFVFDFDGAAFLLGDILKQTLINFSKDGHVSYHASFHYNFS